MDWDRIDAKIDQTIKKLVQLKAMKQAHRQLEPKLISGSVAQLPKTQAFGLWNEFYWWASPD